MIEKLQNIVGLALEIEGLALLASSGRHDLTPELLELLSEKATMLQATVMELPAPEAQAPAEPAETPAEAETAASAAFEQQADADDDEPLMAIVEDDEEEAVAEEAPAAGQQPQAATVEEKLARDRAADIFRAFTINDKFRFIRALFRGSETEFDDTLATIASMSSMAEAEEYFYDDLCWDPADPDVEAFMEIVKSHF